MKMRTLFKVPLMALAATLASAGAFAAGPASQAVDAAVVPESCPTAMPLGEVQRGMVGTGYTVVTGTEPVEFTAEVLGVYPDGAFTGVDMIIAKLGGQPVVDAGGAWYGMSGSPVLYEGRLLGAVAWKLSWGASDVVGLTAGEDLRELADVGVTTAATAAAAKVDLSAGMERVIAAATDEPSTEFGDSFIPMPLSASVSGAGPGSVKRFAAGLRERGVTAQVHPGASVAPSALTADATPVPGGNFAVSFSYGAVTSGGYGTSTLVCGDKVVAFGHPFNPWGSLGPAGANGATAIGVVKDSLDASSKLAVIESTFGTVEWDGFTGVRADLSKAPVTVPVHSKVYSENTGRMVDDTTWVVMRRWLPWLAFEHVYATAQSAMLQYSGGSAEATFVVRGMRADGVTPWKVTFDDAYVSRWSAAYPPAEHLQSTLSTIRRNPFESVSITSADVTTMTVRKQQRRATLERVLLAVGDGAFKSLDRIVVRPGAVLRVKSVLERQDGSKVTRINKVKVPSTARRGGRIDVFGGPGSQPTPRSFDGLLRNIRSQKPATNLGVGLWIDGRKVVERSQDLGRVVEGSKSIAVVVRR